MSWRPAPTVRNPLVALRRVVEAPDPEVIEGWDDERVVVALAIATAPSERPSAPDEGPRTLTPLAHPEGRSLPQRSRGRRARERDRAEHPRALPDRPVQAVITSTPVEPHPPAAHGGTGGTPTVAHAAAGPWSTLPDAPPSTPTFLRASPGSPAGGSTATATGRSASVSNGVAPPRRRPRPDPAPAPPPAPAVARGTAPAPATARQIAPDPAAAPAVAIPAAGTGAPASRPTVSAPVVPLALPLPATATPRPMTVLQVMTTMTVALLVWSLVAAPALLHGAETSPLGTRRNVALTVLRPLDRASAALGLDRVSHLADNLLGRHPARTPAPATHPAPPAPATGSAAPVHAPTTIPALPPLRVGTAADPLRVLVIGDSIGLSFGDSMANKLGASGVVTATVDAREGTGLSRPDAFDWPAQLQADLARFHPDAVIAMFGGNDDQDTIVNGRYITFASGAWTQIYGSRVVAVADSVHAAGARLLWSGLPVVRSAGKSQRFQQVMAVTRAALAGRDGALFVDNYAALADAAGHYAVALTDPSGQVVIVREPDGIHLSPAGADRLADRAIAAMQAQWHLDLRPPPPPSTTIRTPATLLG